MNQEKYIGMDVHQATLSVAVMDAQGKLIMECLLETKAATVVEFIRGLHGTLSLTFEEGTSAAWLHDLLKPLVSRLVVCDPRKNALLKDGNKSDRIDARKLAELLRGNQLHPVYHGEHGVRTLKELGRSYLTITQDVTRVMNRIKALYRSWAIPCAGTTVYAPRHRAEWLAKIVEPGVRLRAERLYQQLDLLQPVRLEARRELLTESHKHAPVKLLRQIPSIGPIRSALLVALLQTPHRFRTKRQLWAYSGFAVETHDSGEYRSVRGKLQRNRERMTVRGLNDNHNRDLKNLFKSAGHLCQLPSRPPARLLSGSGGERDAADDGPSYSGTEDCRHHFNDVEERSEFRLQTTAATNSLSISEEQAFPSLRLSPVVGGRVLQMLGFEGEYQSMRSAPCASAPSHPLHAMPPRITRNSDRPRASDRTMVDIRPACRVLHTRCVATSSQRKLTRMDNNNKPNISRGNETEWAGSRERTSILRSRRSFFLDIPFYRTH